MLLMRESCRFLTGGGFALSRVGVRPPSHISGSQHRTRDFETLACLGALVGGSHGDAQFRGMFGNVLFFDYEDFAYN